MSFIEGFPHAVTFEQMQAACAALGLPTGNVRAVYMDVRDGVTVELYVADDTGRKLHHNGPLTTELRIPLAREEEADGGTT